VEKNDVGNDGGTVWANLTGSLVRRPDGAPDNFTAVVEDICRRKRVDVVQEYLGAANQVLAASLDGEETLARVARLAVPFLGDWSQIYLLEGD
jgi:hypothetical protein